MTITEQVPVVVLGAGPAGLGLAYRLAVRRAFDVTVLERGPHVGGNAGSFELGGITVDYGSHRLHPACDAAILGDIRRMLGGDLLQRPRHGRIRLRGRWVHFPLKPFNLALHLPPSFLFGVACDAISGARNGNGQPETFGSVLQKGLGTTICRDFYFPYAEKIWGRSPFQLDAEQARRRVQSASLAKMASKVARALPGARRGGFGRFYYPRGGFGQISDAYRRAAEDAGARVFLRTTAQEVRVNGQRRSLVIAEGSDGPIEFPARHVFSTIPLPHLASIVCPEPPDEVKQAAGDLSYRAMILVYLLLACDRYTEFDAHYFPDREIRITRLSEPKNYGLSPIDGRTVLCAELPCDVDDDVWRMSDDQLRALVLEDLQRASLPRDTEVCEVVTRRLPQAYPIYTSRYGQHFETLDHWADHFDGLTTLGRQGLFAHDNTHHTLAMAYAAVECLDEQGTFDRSRWARCRESFTAHVVED